MFHVQVLMLVQTEQAYHVEVLLVEATQVQAATHVLLDTSAVL